MSTRLALPNRCHHLTQKVKVAGQRTLYISVHDDEQPGEVFLRLKGPDCSSELIGLYDVIARLMCLALQYGAPLENVGDLLADAKFAPCGPVVGHDRIKHCSSLSDLIGRHLLVEYCGRAELAHAMTGLIQQTAPPTAKTPAPSTTSGKASAIRNPVLRQSVQQAQNGVTAPHSQDFRAAVLEQGSPPEQTDSRHAGSHVRAPAREMSRE
jgi:hypothetical protein